ncbi:glycosyltransferase [Domibacillus sp. A3M-37]|uniref:glycosyltransferase n=1 Tax=Domibacillus sp. A3M-37 TaxID=2962037 RepID=UPI0020B84FA5|nr:glycosyltransferase [Domibacillus sp. A3M-37]MCP3761405.1 glycosyltransferase [Domibacillus sp. A3M-37]
MKEAETPKVSVIMGIYNCEDTLKESIESIINQTYKNWELILCDDMSADRTYNIAKSYVCKYPDKIRLIKNDRNSGLAWSLNHCLEYVTGEYIARQDGDDLSVKDRFEIQVKFLEENKEYDLVGSKMISFDESGIKGIRGVPFDEPHICDLSKSTAFCHATIMSRSYVYRELNGYRVNQYTMRCEDVDLWFRFFAKGYRGYNLQEGLYMVRDDLDSYKRRTVKSYIYLMKVNYEGYRLVNMPKKHYIYLLKPILSLITPKFIMKSYHNKKYSNLFKMNDHRL